LTTSKHVNFAALDTYDEVCVAGA